MFRGMAQLALGGILARCISLITVPIVSRIYSPSDFGLLSIYASFIQILLPVFTLRYVFAVPLPRQDRTALNLFGLCAVAGLGQTVIVTIALLFFGKPILDMFSAGKLAAWWWLIALGSLMLGMAELLGAWATRRRAYKRMAVNSVTILVLGEGLKIGLGLLGFRPFGLIVGQMTGQSGGIVSFTRAFAADFKRLPHVVTWRRMWFLARYYWSYPALRLPSQFLLAFSVQAPLLYTAKLYGIAASGQVGLSLMTLAVPLNLIGQAMGKAHYAEVARLGRSRTHEIHVLTKKTQLTLFAVGLPPTLILFFFGREIFAFAFGVKWSDAGEYAAILSLYMLLQFTSQPLIQLLNVFNKQSMFLAINLFRSGLIVALFWACQHFSIGILTYVRAYSFVMAGFYAIITLYIFNMTRQLTLRRA
jgi:O-antigen/teichoic acid export membrane protein